MVERSWGGGDGQSQGQQLASEIYDLTLTLSESLFFSLQNEVISIT